MRKEPSVSVGALRSVLTYDEMSGRFTWRTGQRHGGKIAGTLRADGYLYISIRRRQYPAHRLAWYWVTGRWPSDDLDHINGARSDNRFANMRIAGKIINNQNIRRPHADSETGILGVRNTPAGKFRAQINVCGRQMNLGTFTNKQRARKAYVKAKRKFHEGCTI